MGSKADRRAAREVVAAYHEACLAELIGHVEVAIEALRAAQLDPYDVDEVIHRYHRAARKLWTFCWAAGSGAHVESTAGTIARQAAEHDAIDWWDLGGPRGRRDGSA